MCRHGVTRPQWVKWTTSKTAWEVSNPWILHHLWVHHLTAINFSRSWLPAIRHDICSSTVFYLSASSNQWQAPGSPATIGTNYTKVSVHCPSSAHNSWWHLGTYLLEPVSLHPKRNILCLSLVAFCCGLVTFTHNVINDSTSQEICILHIIVFYWGLVPVNFTYILH